MDVATASPPKAPGEIHEEHHPIKRKESERERDIRTRSSTLESRGARRPDLDPPISLIFVGARTVFHLAT